MGPAMVCPAGAPDVNSCPGVCSGVRSCPAPRWMLLPCLVCLLVGLVSPARAAEAGEDPVSVPMDGIVTEDPPPAADAVPELTDTPLDGLGGDTLDDISLAETADYTELLEVVSNIEAHSANCETLLAYIFVGILLQFAVTAAKLIYSFFNMFF